MEDDGIGADLCGETLKVRSDGGFGLFSIRERMSDLGGSLEMVSTPGEGLKAILIMPLGG